MSVWEHHTQRPGIRLKAATASGVIFLLTLFCVLAFLIRLRPYQFTQAESAQTQLRALSSSQMLAIADCLAVYADSQPGRRLPGADEDWVRLLRDEAFAASEYFYGPGRSDGVIVYFYVPAERITFDANRVLLYEHPDLFKDGTNVLFHDFGREFIPEPEATRLIGGLRLEDGTPWAPHESVHLSEP